MDVRGASTKNNQKVLDKIVQPVENISNTSRVTRSGRFFAPIINQKSKNNDVRKSVPTTREVNNEVVESSKEAEEEDEVLKIIKRSEYKVVDQLLQTPSKISILSLLLNSEAYKSSLMKIIDQAYVEQDVTTKQFDTIVGNITACNNLSFCDDELPEEGSSYNLALNISINCGSDTQILWNFNENVRMNFDFVTFDFDGLQKFGDLGFRVLTLPSFNDFPCKFSADFLKDVQY